jgi:PAS domain S-box-containing protein
VNCAFVYDITEKKKLEDRLQLVNFSFKNAVTPIVFIREDGMFHDFNEAYLQLSGYSREELLARKLFDINNSFDEINWPCHWNELKEKGTLSFISNRTRKDGSIRTVDVRANLINFRGIELNCAFITDITEKNKAEEALKLSNERYEYATLATSDVVWETDLINDVLYLGNNFTAIFGLHTTGIEYGQTNVWRNNLHPDDLQSTLEKEYNSIIGKSDKWESEYRLRKGNGDYAIVLDRGFVVKDGDGKAVKLIGAMQDITEKKKIEEELKRSNQRYEYATRATSDVVWETDLLANAIYLSNNFTHIYGHAVKEVEPLGNSVWTRNVHPDDLQKVLNTEKEVINSNGDKWVAEYRFRKADGSYAFVLDRSFAIKDENGIVTGMIGSMQDVTETKMYEHELMKSNLRFEYATLATSDVIWESDLIEKTYFSSKSFTELFGHKSGIYEDIDDNEWVRNVHPDDLKIVLNHSNASIDNGEVTWQNEYRFRMSNGEYVNIFDRVLLIRDENGNAIKLVGSLQNVTEIKQREERLKLSETVITNTTDAIIIRDSKRLTTGGLPVLYTNYAFTQMTGYSFEEVKGITLKLLNGPLTSRKERDELRYSIDNFLEGKVEMIQYKKDGTPYWASISVFPVAHENGEFTHWVSIQRDITQKKKAEEEREHLLNELISNNKELKQFGYITTHNLRAPLTNLVSICKFLDLDTISDLRNKKLIEGFKQSTIQLNDTLNDLINILIIKENRNLPTAELGFHEMLNRVLNSISNTFSIAEAVIVSDFSEAPFVEFSNTYLESIFLNLLTNAIKYAHPDRKPFIKINTVRNENGTTKLIFSDNGIGMNMQRVKDRIFGLYQRFHNNSDSKGIGLYLVHSQITALGGSIEVETEENVGTTFIITFK